MVSMKKLYLVDLEDVSTRYTGEWKKYIPELLSSELQNYEVVVIDGDQRTNVATEGAFLNFIETNRYKNNQMNKIVDLFNEDKIGMGDVFLFTDVWHTGIIQLKYMASLTKKYIEIHGLIHAGSYDPADWLGQRFDKTWSFSFEKSLISACTKVWFATEFHQKMCRANLGLSKGTVETRFERTGWPMDYMPELLREYTGTPKTNTVIFPHRMAPEKQPEIAKLLQQEMPDVEFIFCQEQKMNKKEYHMALARSKVLFSASNQETLGITPYEGMILGVIPLVPDRLSYTEMYSDHFKYPSMWTYNIYEARGNLDNLIRAIRDRLENYDSYKLHLDNELTKIKDKFFTATNLVNYFKAK